MFLYRIVPMSSGVHGGGVVWITGRIRTIEWKLRVTSNIQKIIAQSESKLRKTEILHVTVYNNNNNYDNNCNSNFKGKYWAIFGSKLS